MRPSALLLAALPVLAAAQGDPPRAREPYRVTMQRVGDEVVLEAGPIDLPITGPRTVGGTPPFRLAIPVDGWFRGYRIEVVDAAGAPVPEHLVVLNVVSLAERELFSPIALRVATIAPGAPSAPLPRILGYRAVAGDTLLVTAQFHRADGRPWAGVRARIRFPFVAKGSFIGAMRIQPFSIEALPPGGSKVFDLPPGRSEQSWEGRPAVGGRVMGFGAHVKKYATVIRFEDRTARKVLWEHKADTTASGDVRAIPVKRFLLRFGLGLDSAHTYRLTVEYDNRSGATIPGGGAGAIGGVYLVGDGGRWPRVNTSDSLFVSDLRALMR